MSFGTELHESGDGFFEVDLVRREMQHVCIGRLSFISQSPTELGVAVAAELTADVGELKNVDLVASARGHGGASQLMLKMSAVLRERGCEYVLLEHLDRGSGRLIKYYERLGFRFMRDALPTPIEPASELEEALSPRHMLVKLEDLHRTLLAETQRVAARGDVARDP